MSLLTPDEIALLSDSKYKSYVSAIEKALKNFESSTEWADLISSLGKLKKVLQSFPKYPYIPKRVSVSKRLAQCLHPALPSGVHLKALEVYTVVFQNIGSDMLSRDIFLYSSGLFPLLANAALSVKPVLLSMYETYFLPLKTLLKPCLVGLLIGILPGLEDGSDFYQRSFNLLKNICLAQSEPSTTSPTSNTTLIAEDKYFYTCLWSAIVSQSSIRFPAIQFILTNFENKKRLNAHAAASMSPVDTESASALNIKPKSDIYDQLYLIGNSIDLMINGICCCLQDSNPLVQRSILDLICFCLPIDTKQITRNDKIQLIIVAIHVVLRRDMSLNRRIYSWLTGSNNNSPAAPVTPTASASTPTNSLAGASSIESISSNLHGANSSASDQQSSTTLNETASASPSFFNTHSRPLLIAAIKMLLNSRRNESPSNPILYLFTDDASSSLGGSLNPMGTVSAATGQASLNGTSTNSILRIIKIVSNLVERQEIGQNIIDDVLLDLLFFIHKECQYLSTSSQLNKSANVNVNSNGLTPSQQSLKEIKKATCNFLFQSFQLYFIWDFCATKFEKVCRNYTSNNNSRANEMALQSNSVNSFDLLNVDTDSIVSPAQLCDLYRFILDLLSNSEIYNEIQTEHLPMMLKRIIQTLNTYCSRMSNIDLSKSFLLCLKILNKVVPKIADPESGGQESTSRKDQNSSGPTTVTESSSLKRVETATLPNRPTTPADQSPVFTLKTNDSDDENDDEPIDSCVRHVLNDIISLIELEQDDKSTQQIDEVEVAIAPSKSQELLSVGDEDGRYLIDTCLVYLKQLCYTFVTSHLFQATSMSDIDEQLGKSFQSLFVSETNRASKFDEKLMMDDQTIYQATLSSLNLVKLKPDSMNYLQAFQILNRLLIKMLFFPREPSSLSTESSESNNASNSLDETERLFQASFENWLKALFVISCTSQFSNHSFSPKLFEFQSVTLNTIIELVHLSESVNSHFKQASNNAVVSLAETLKPPSLDPPSESASNTNGSKSNKSSICLLQTVFTQKQLDMLLESSNFGYLVAHMLWSYLNNYRSKNMDSGLSSYEEVNSATDKRAAMLFCQLNELLPSNLCEDLICTNLKASSLAARIDAFKRFTRLWHWSRELNVSTAGSGSVSSSSEESLDDEMPASTIKYVRLTKTFERSLLILIDTMSDMSEDGTSSKTLTKLIQDWLTTCIYEYNDLPRIFDIMLVSLLHPTTARVSVHHFLGKVMSASGLIGGDGVKDSNGDMNDKDDYESKVYAISNEGGNVKYHVSKDSPQLQTPGSSQQMLLLTSIDQTSASQSNSKPVKSSNIELPLSVLNAASLGSSNMGLHINPFLAAKSSQSAAAKSSPNTVVTSNHEDEDETDSTRNAKLLESYKAIKASQMKEVAAKLHSPASANQLSASVSPNKAFNRSLETCNKNSGSLPSIVVASSNSTSNQNLERGDNNEDNEDDSSDDSGSNDEDEVGSIGEQDNDEFDLESYGNSDDEYENTICSFNQSGENHEDSHGSQLTVELNSDSVIKSPSSQKAKKSAAKSRENSKHRSLNRREKPKLAGSKSELSKSQQLLSTSTSNPLEYGAVVDSQVNPNGAVVSLSTAPTRHRFTTTPHTSTLQRAQAPAFKELCVDAMNAVDPNFAYMLIYTNCNNIQTHLQSSRLTNKLVVASTFTNKSYDCFKVHFVLKLIEHLLDKCDKEFLMAAITTKLNNSSTTSNANGSISGCYSATSSNSVFSVYNEKLLDLIIRHLKSLYGNSFYNNMASFDLNRLNLNLNSTTYIEAITLILLFYVRAYYPPSRFVLTTNIADNPATRLLNMNKSVSNGSLHSSASQSSNNSSVMSDSGVSESLSDEDLFSENRNIQIHSLKLLTRIIKELVDQSKNLPRLSQSTGQNGNQYLANSLVWHQSITDLLEKTRLQKTLLHCFYSTIFTPAANTLSSCILSQATNKQTQFVYVCELMNSLESLIELEKVLNDYQVILKNQKNNTSTSLSAALAQLASNKPTLSSNTSLLTIQSQQDSQPANDDDLLLTLSISAASSAPGNPNNKKSSSQTQFAVSSTASQSTRYIQNQTICNQSMFISSVLHYLKSMSLVDYHLPVLNLIKDSLSSCGGSLKSISTYIIEQLCRNLLYITNGGMSSGGMSIGGGSSSMQQNIMPLIGYMSSVSLSINIPDFVISVIKQLSFLIHYSLISPNNSSFTQTQLIMSISDSNLSSSANVENQFRLFRLFQVDNEMNLTQTKECLIHLLPSILSSMAQVWQRCNLLLNSSSLYGVNFVFDNNAAASGSLVQPHPQPNQQYSWILGHPIAIKQCITDMLNPIAQTHSLQFMTAIGTVWGERRKRSRVYHDHKIIIELVRSCKSFPISVIVQNITDILKQSAQSSKDKKKNPLNVWLLQFLHSYLEIYLSCLKPKPSTISSTSTTRVQSDTIVSNELAQCLCNFFKESLSSSTVSSLAPACYFQLFRILHDTVNNFPLIVEDRKYSKDIQDITHKLFEICNSIVALSLEQTTWLRKNYAVKLAPSNVNHSQSSNPSNNSGTSSSSSSSAVSANNTTANTPTQSSANINGNSSNNSTIIVGAGPSMGGAILIHNSSVSSSNNHDKMSVSNMSAISSATNTTAGANTSLASSNANTTTTSGYASMSTNNTTKSKTNGMNNNYSDLESEITSNMSDTAANLNIIDNFTTNFDLNDTNSNLAHSLQALNILAEYLAKTLDIVYKSEEKDRLVVPLLMSLMSNLWPYLKTHSVANKSNYRAASHLLMTLTFYTYTRKTWKKEAFEMLFENQFFHVDSVTLEYSRAIIDNLISNDRTMFKDVLTRVTYQQSGGLFSSKEQESEQKAQLLKRLAFVIYSSEKDQYQKNMPEIQECIAHVLKLTQSANLYSTLFLLFRILLLRISSRHLIALWPTFLSELTIILLQIEQDLSEDLEIKTSKGSYLDHIVSTTNSYQQNNNFKLQIYLSACKLIDLILTLPNSLTTQFQLYKWSFVNTEDMIDLRQRDQVFVPYLIKINNLMKIRFPNAKTTNYKLGTGPIIKQRSIQSISDLRSFFQIVTAPTFVHNSNQATQSMTNNLSSSASHQTSFPLQLQQHQSSLFNMNNPMRLFEASVHDDFLEGFIE